MIDNWFDRENALQNTDELSLFLKHWLEHKPFQPPFDPNTVTFDDKVIGTTLYRQDDFQVQLFTVKPNTEIVDHIHPNVDSFEVYLSGEISFRRNKKKITGKKFWREHNNTCIYFGYFIRVNANDYHGATTGDMGGSFLSVQHWKNGTSPSSVHLDWEFKDSNINLRNY
jgi:mannose-6-phosphate isomerase-like protein (cupin superfamily)